MICWSFVDLLPRNVHKTNSSYIIHQWKTNTNVFASKSIEFLSIISIAHPEQEASLFACEIWELFHQKQKFASPVPWQSIGLSWKVNLDNGNLETEWLLGLLAGGLFSGSKVKFRYKYKYKHNTIQIQDWWLWVMQTQVQNNNTNTNSKELSDSQGFWPVNG